MSSQSQEAATRRVADDEYSIRWFRSGDADAIIALFADELGRDRSRAYVEWKYVDDPYLDHVPITVAERDDDLVGVQAYVPARLSDGDRSVLALQPVDAVVHADHRRNGLYARMTRAAIERYEAGDASLFFNYPTPGALGAQEKLDWESLGDLAVYYRIHQPSAFLGSAVDSAGGRALGVVADALARGAFGVVDRAAPPSASLRVAPSSASLRVERHDGVPAGTLASLYELSVPDRIHVHREPRFYEWWLGGPRADPTTYVARSNGEPVAGLVTRVAGDGVLQLRDAVPLPPDQPEPALGRLLAAAIDDHPDAAVVKSVGETLPAALLRRFGFVRDSTSVLDGRTTPFTMAARPLADDGVADAVTDRANWLPTFLEADKD